MDLDYELVRRGRAPESARRLAKLAEEAERAGFGHGVSLTTPDSNNKLADDPFDAVRALKSAFEKSGFHVILTPTRRDPTHHTVVLPKPVTPQFARMFNDVLRRGRK